MHLGFMMCNCAQKPNDENPEPAVVLHRIFVRQRRRRLALSRRIRRRIRRQRRVDEVCTRLRRFESRIRGGNELKS